MTTMEFTTNRGEPSKQMTPHQRGKLLADFCQGLIRKVDQMEMVNGNGVGLQPHPQCLAE